MRYITEFMFIFAFCATAGWVLEVIYRSIKNKRFINPGFLTGCCLPIYGTGGLALYILCLPISAIENPCLRICAVFFGGAAVMTIIEFAGGMIALKSYHIMLWDYSKLKFNYKGLICPLFSACWGLCCVFFYFVLFPKLSLLAANSENNNLLLLIIGFYYGIFTVDLSESMNFAEKLKEYSKAIKGTVNVENIKKAAQEAAEKYMKKRKPIVIFHHASIKNYISELKNITHEKKELLTEYFASKK